MELKETKIEIDDSELPAEKPMQCSSNFEDHSFYNVEDHIDEDHCHDVLVVNKEAEAEVEEEEDEEVDIMECSGFNDKKEIEVSECDDVYSSSFSGTVSEDGNETALNDDDDQEADSMVCTDNDSLPVCVRKRKLTDHWRRFIQPIMWRCKWIELKIKEVQNQAKIYDKELEETRVGKQSELENVKSEEEVGVKALPALPSHSQKTQLKKRKKRERVEETSDVASYTLNHNLFSYHEYRKTFADIALNDNSRNLDKRTKSAKDETVFCDETPPLEFKEGDALLEQILLKIEAAKLEARNLKNRLDKLMNENPIKFSSVKTLDLLGSADAVFTSSEQQNPLLVIKNEDEKPVITEETPVKSASVSSHHDSPAEEDDEATDILLSEIAASRGRAGKGIVIDKKQQTPVEEGPSRPARKRIPRNLDIVTKEETKPKRQRVSREKPKSNAMASRFKLPNRKRMRGKRRSGPAGLRRRS